VRDFKPKIAAFAWCATREGENLIIKVEVGSTFDLNQLFDNTALSETMSYFISVSQQQFATVESETGALTAHKPGDCTVKVHNAVTGNFISEIQIQILSSQDWLAYTFALVNFPSNSNPELLIRFEQDKNTPKNILAVDQGDNTVLITFMNDEAVVDRAFQIGLREVGSSANSVNTTGRHEFVTNLVLSGVGPHSFTLPTALPSGNYEAYVQDLEDATVGFKAFAFVHEYPPFNTPILVAGQDATNNYINITFSNTNPVVNRNFQIGIRNVGSGAHSSVSAGRQEFLDNLRFSGLGPHSTSLLSNVADGDYEVYVEDLIDGTIGFAPVTIDTQDLTPPQATVSAQWSAYTNEITVSWIADDSESAITSTLDLRSQDGTSVLIDAQDVSSDADNTLKVSAQPNGKTYVAKLLVENAEGLTREVTTNVTLPSSQNQPSSLSGTDSGNNTITVSWLNSILVQGHAFVVGLRTAGTAANGTVSTGRLAISPQVSLSGVGPLSSLLSVSNDVSSGNYELFVHDLDPTSNLFAVIPFAYTRQDQTPPVINLNASWSNGQFVIAWTVADAESAVTSKILDVRSSNGAVVLLNNSNVTSVASNSTIVARSADGLTYYVKLKATNANNKQAESTVSVVLPPPMSLPYNLLATQQTDETAVAISWRTATNVTQRIFQVGLRQVGSSASAINATGRIAYSAATSVSGFGPYSVSVSMPLTYQTGNYEAYVHDLITNEIISASFSYQFPEVLERINPYMISNTQKGPYTQFAAIPSGIASASSISSPTHDAYVAFDGTYNDVTCWRSNLGSPQWLGYQFSTATTVEAYTLYGCLDGTTHWTAWQFQGSSDGINWTTLDTKIGEARFAGGRADKKTYILAQPANYTYYRIYVTALGSSALNNTALGELSLQRQGSGSFE
jgi:hypothetical protein